MRAKAQSQSYSRPLAAGIRVQAQCQGSQLTVKLPALSDKSSPNKYTAAECTGAGLVLRASNYQQKKERIAAIIADFVTGTEPKKLDDTLGVFQRRDMFLSKVYSKRRSYSIDCVLNAKKQKNKNQQTFLAEKSRKEKLFAKFLRHKVRNQGARSKMQNRVKTESIQDCRQPSFFKKQTLQVKKCALSIHFLKKAKRSTHFNHLKQINNVSS